MLTASTGTAHVDGAPFWVYALPITGMASMALVTLVHRRWTTNVLPVYQSLMFQCTTSTLVFLPFALQSGSILPALVAGFRIGIAWLVALATLGSYGLYHVYLSRFSPTKVSTVLYLSPPATMLWARAMFGEPISPGMGIGLVLRLGGVFIANRDEQH